MKLARVKEELAEQTKDAVLEVENEIWFLNKGIKVAETSVEEVNQELAEAMEGKTLKRDKIISCQSKITMGLKSKTELNEKLRKMVEKKIKLCTL